MSQVGYASIMKVCIYRRAESTGSTIYVCMHACMNVLCMYVCTLFGALIGALGDMDVSQVEYACTMNVCTCIYRRSENTGSTIYVCMHAYMYVLCMCVCMYAIRRAICSPSAVVKIASLGGPVTKCCIYRLPLAYDILYVHQVLL